MIKQWVAKLLEKLVYNPDLPSTFKEEHNFYAFNIGKLKNSSKLSNYKIDDPDIELLLKEAEYFFEDLFLCFQQKSLEVFFKRNFSVKELEKSIEDYSPQGKKHLSEYKQKAKKNVPLFKQRYKTSEEEALGCCLALAYYTGSYSERISRESNIVIKLKVKDSLSLVGQNLQNIINATCIGHWLFKALNHIPLHWGAVTRCINLQEEEKQIYQTGNIVTWLQFSSSSYGSITQSFQDRNTRFVIYSLSGRCIEKFSEFKRETEVLFKPYSHFMVIKTELKKIDGNQKLYIYMREIFIGQSKKNTLWVDDQIYNSKWGNKSYMERAMNMDPLANIIPKNSTQCALAFLQSPLGSCRNPLEFRIMTDMTRNNENPSYNAGARFIQQCRKKGYPYEIMIFTSNVQHAKKMLEALNVNLDNIKITVDPQQAIKFLCFK